MTAGPSRLAELRAKYGTLSTKELHDRINLRGAVNERYREIVRTQSNNERGPVLAGVMDTQTGRVFFGQNTGIPTRLHPEMAARLEGYPANWQAIYSKAAPGTHAEFVALNEALLARPGARLGDFTFTTVWLRGSRTGLPIPRCPHCETLTSGVRYFPEPLRFGKDKGP